jgi:hypothetical protein
VRRGNIPPFAGREFTSAVFFAVMNAHHVNLDLLEDLGVLTGWDYFLEGSLSLRGGPPACSFTPKAPPTRPPLEDILDPEGTYTGEAQHEEELDVPLPMPINPPALSSGSSSSSSHFSDYELDDDHGGRRW